MEDLVGVVEAYRRLVADPTHVDLVRDSYWDDPSAAAERFLRSAEFAATRALLGSHLEGARLLDVGAGRGIASYAFCKSGARVVYAVEPEPSLELGWRCVRDLAGDLPLRVLAGSAAALPLASGSFDIVYARQVLHHVTDHRLVMSECARVLRRGGVLFACREHVAETDAEHAAFLAGHPVHQLAGGENAFPVETYISAIRESGFRLLRVLDPWDSIINCYPRFRSESERQAYPRTILRRRLGVAGDLLGRIPPVRALVWRRVRANREPGRMYSFLAAKA